MAEGDVADAWSRYRDLIEQVYRQDAESIREGREAQILEPPADDLIQAALIRSEELTSVILAELLSGNVSGRQRELALAQLGAAATIDLSIADDLARIEPAETDGDELGEPSLTHTFAAAASVLEASREDPWERIIAGGAEVPAGLRGALQSRSGSVTNEIIDEVREIVMKTTGDFIGATMTDLVLAPVVPIEDLFRELARHVGPVRRAAVKFVLNGIKKLLAFLGVDANSVRSRVAILLEHQIPRIVRDMLALLYDSRGLEMELAASIAGGRSEHLMGDADRELAHLGRRFAKNMEITGGVVHVLKKVKRWLFHAATPHSQVAVTAAYLTITGFAIAAGGDYLDSGPIDFIPGVRTIVRRAT
jgi:hypothetical protein